MGITDWLESRLHTPRLLDESTGHILSNFGFLGNAAGISVDEDGALSWSALDAAIQIVATTYATLPKSIRRRLDRGREELPGHHLRQRIHGSPNPEQTSVEFWETYVSNVMLWGDGFAEIVRSGGEIEELWPLNPDRVRPFRRDNGELAYEVTVPSNDRHPNVRSSDRKRVLFADEVFHTRGFATHGVIGQSMAHKHRDAIGLGIATERYVAHFFGQGAMPTGAIQVDDELTDEAHQRMKDDWREIHQGLENSHRIAILEEGAKFQQIMADPEKANATGLRKLNANEASRMTSVPPHMLAELDRATFSNIEQQSLEFVQHTIRPWVVRLEKRMEKDLLTDRETERDLFVDVNMEGLLRADSETRANFYNTLWNMGVLSINDIRELEDMNPVENGDQRYVPLNVIPVDQAQSIPAEQRARMIDAEASEVEVDALEGRETGALPPPQEGRSLQERRRLITNFEPTITDAMERMVRGEVRNLRNQADRLLGEGDPSTFLEWARDYYFGNETELTGEEDTGGGHPEFIRRTLGPVFATYIPEVAEASEREIGESFDDIDQWVDEYTRTFARRYSASSRRALDKNLKESVTEQDNSPEEELQRKTEAWMEGQGENAPRYEQFARNEAQRANHATFYTMAAASALPLRWVAFGENCPFCNRLDGQVVGREVSFVGEGQQFQPEGADTPLVPDEPKNHPPLHGGCDCGIVVAP